MTTYSYYMLTSVDLGETHDRQMFYSMNTLIPGRHGSCPNLASNYQYSFGKIKLYIQRFPKGQRQIENLICYTKLPQKIALNYVNLRFCIHY